MRIPESLLLDRSVILFLANTAVTGAAAAVVCTIVAMAFRRAASPLRQGVLLCGLTLVLLAPAIALVADWTGLGRLEFAINNDNQQVAAQNPTVPDPADETSYSQPSAIPTAPSRPPMSLGKSSIADDFHLKEPKRLLAKPKSPYGNLQELRETRDGSLAGTPISAPVDHSAETPAELQVDVLKQFGSLLAMVWLAGSVIGLLWLVRALARIAGFHRTLRNAGSARVQAVADALAARLGLSFRPRVAVSKRVRSPLAFGLFRPVIVLPEGFAGEFTASQLEGVLIHEMAHIRRRDTLFGLGRQLAAVLFWWCPLVHLQNRRLALLCEEICDNYVAQSQGGGEGFATLLVKMAERVMATDRLPATVGLFESNRGCLEHRVRRLLTLKADAATHVGLKAKGLIAVFGMLLTVTILFVNVRAAINQSDDERSTEKKTSAPAKADHVDRYGDPLPNGALARLGTIRLRHAGLVLCVTYSPDGKMLASAATDNVVRLWDSANGRLLRELPGHDELHSVQFSADGSIVASADRRHVRLWDAKTGKLKRQITGAGELERPGVQSFALSPKGDRLATGTRNSVTLWDVKSGREIHEWEKSTQENSKSLVFSPDGSLLAHGSDEITIWNVKSGEPAQRLSIRDPKAGRARGGNGEPRLVAYAVRFAPDGKFLLAGTTTGQLGLWNVKTGVRLRLNRYHKGFVTSISLSPDGKTIATGSTDRTVGIWDRTTGRSIKTLRGPIDNGFSVFSVAFSPDGKTLATAAANRIWLKDAKSGEEKTQKWFDGAALGQRALAFAPDNQSIATVSMGRQSVDSCNTWQTGTGRHLRKLKLTPGKHANCAFLPDGTLLAVGAPRNGAFSLGFYNPTKSGVAQKVIDIKASWLDRISVLPDKKQFAVSTKYFNFASRDSENRVTLFDSSGRELRNVELDIGKATAIHGFYVSPDGRYAAAMLDPIRKYGEVPTAPVRVWDLTTGKHLHDCTTTEARGWPIAFTSDSKQLLAGTFNTDRNKSSLTVWELATGKRVREIEFSGIVLSVAVTADRQFVAAGLRDGAIRLFNLKTGDQIARLTGHRGWVNGLIFSPDGRLLASCSEDTTGLVWDMAAVRKPALRGNKPEQTIAWGDAENGLRLHAYCDRTVYRLRQDVINVTYIIQNVGKKPKAVTLQVTAEERTDAAITDSRGKLLIVPGYQGPRTETILRRVTIPPGKVARVTMLIDPQKVGLSSGRYVLHGLFRTYSRGVDGLGRPLRDGDDPVVELKSNKLTFTIVDPKSTALLPRGPSKGTCSLSLSCDQTVWRKGDGPIPFAVILNREDDEEGYRLFSVVGLTYYKLEVTGPDGKKFMVPQPVPLPSRVSPHFRFSMNNVPTGKSVGERLAWNPTGTAFKRTLDLGLFLTSSGPAAPIAGKYKVRAIYDVDAQAEAKFGYAITADHLESNVVEVTIAPAEGKASRKEAKDNTAGTKHLHAEARKVIMQSCARIHAINRSLKPGVWESTPGNLRSKEIMHIRNHKAYVKFVRDKSLSVTDKVDSLYRWIYFRPPTKAERELVVNFIRKAKDLDEAFLRLLWGLVNHKEFYAMAPAMPAKVSEDPHPTIDEFRLAQGTWNIVRHKVGGTGIGKQDGSGPPLGPQVKISGNNVIFQLRPDDPKDQKSMFYIRRLNGKAIPKQIDAAVPKDGKWLVRKGIYLLEKDLIKCEFANPGQPRPKRFEAKPNSPTNFFILRREKPQDD